MKITLFAVIMLAMVFVKSWHSNAEYTVQGNHWEKDETVPYTREGLKTFTKALKNEFEELYKLQDATAMAAKSTPDSVYIHQDIGILRGREEIRIGYQKLFDSGKASVDVEILEETDTGTLGRGYMHVFVREHYFDKDNNKIGVSKVFLVLKHVEGGYQVYLKSEMTG
ncbi:uncharacterized protein [Amphiura filiformis]|uniref:uncharacterized protein n=1 Tax=Amphiura filiformis TaxID=82378 RepID=UPI003B20C266